jgi:hypothetical protein
VDRLTLVRGRRRNPACENHFFEAQQPGQKHSAGEKKKQEATPAKWIDTSQLSPTCLEALDEGPELGRCNWVEFR